MQGQFRPFAENAPDAVELVPIEGLVEWNGRGVQ